ncbi:DUF2188 domain-containing protein [Paenibacillus sp. FSL H7-0331]|uniref:DUF2188 domain-containing protein n=1 Tax=Paenibacillus sp. FSL H7-0331 TaxID=1920421 RepID=UPI00096D0CC4|nr:DUF2188 domain-containing protein [Paenibacillus sp. FSL H7-0331]OMF15978.1 hypothetical protein BK127_14055 [Paenibacillus sp. FSL H7-0331]
MPWKKNDYPVSMKNLEPRVRNKAVEIANALLEDGYEEGRAIAIATAKGEEWDDNHPLQRQKHEEKEATSTQSNQQSASHNEHSGHNLHVVPDGDGWAVKVEGFHDVRLNTETKAEAVEKAKQWASDTNSSAIIHRKNGTVETSHNYS